MSDIVERLRKGIEWTGPTQDDTGQTENLMDEAADEIERLREWNREIALNAREFVAENEKLRAALSGVLWMAEEWFRHGGDETTLADDYEKQLEAARATLEEKP